MSGIAGIVNLNGAPVDQHLLARMIRSLAASGPDAQSTWIDGAAGFGHALLRTTDEAEHERQPLTLDDKIWVVADARIDARDVLMAELRAGGQEAERGVPDVELIARAYAVWGERCVEHLLGDFAFAVWDAPRNLLFCVRDHLGVKPLYYAHLGSSVVFSNALDCVRLNPAVSSRLNDRAIADFLLFNLNQEQSKTIFTDIERLAPGHMLMCSAEGVRLRRYWALPIDEPIFYAKENDYPDRFKELLQSAIQDRLRTQRVSVLMSGGLDSTTLAATAKCLLTGRGENSGVRAFTVAHHGGDEETAHAKLAAQSLGVPIELQYWEPARFNVQWHKMSLHIPEPIPYPTDLLRDWEDYRQLASHSRVAFQGEGPDNALRCEWRPYFSHLLRKGHLGRLLYDLYFQTVLHGQLPLPRIPWMTGMRPNQEKPDDFPDWFRPAFEKQYELRSRWDQIRTQPAAHPIRPLAYGSLASPLWQSMFERFQPEYTRSAFEVRHPYLDVRVLRFMLAVPVLPWCRHKYLLRRAMLETLPAAVLARPKVPLTNDPWAKHVQELGLPPVEFTEVLAQYVDKGRLSQAPSDPSRFWVDFRVRSLSYWLRNMSLP